MSWLNLILEDILFEAKTPEEIKQMLEYQFVEKQGVPQDVLDAIFAIDPTKKKSYTKWGLTMYVNDKEKVTNAIKDGTLDKIFKYFQERAGSGLNLAQMETFDDAEGYLPRDFVNSEVLKKVGDGGPQDDYNIVFGSNEWIIALPHTYEAARKLGQGCRWCTADAFGGEGSGRHYWDDYSSDGPIWVNFDLREEEYGPMDGKKYPFTRYQFCFESKDHHERGEIMDSNDNLIDDIMDVTHMPQNVIDFYGEQNEEYKDRIVLSEREWYRREEEKRYEKMEEYNEERWDHAICVMCHENNDKYLTLMPEFNDDLEFDETDSYYLYNEDNDTQYPICDYHFDPENFILKSYGQDSPVIFLKPLSYRTSVVGICYADDDNEFHVYDDMDAYGELGEYPYIFNDGYLLVFNKKKLWFCEGILDFSRNDVRKIFSPFSSDDDYLWVEIIASDSLHSLIRINTYNSDFDIIIKKDKPINENSYEISYDNKNRSYIQGVYSKHYIGEVEGDDIEKGFNIERHLYDNRYYLAVVDDDDFYGDLYNIYDAQEQKMLLPEPCTDCGYSERNGNFRVYFKNGESIYNIKSHEFAIPPCEHISGTGRYVVAHNIFGKEDGDYLFYINKEENFINMNCYFPRIERRLCGDYLIVKNEEGFYDLFNAESGELLFPPKVTYYRDALGGVNSLYPYLYIIQNNDNNIKLFNIATGKIVSEHLLPTIIRKIGDNALKVYFEGQKSNILYKDKFVLSQPVDNISNCANENTVFQVHNNGRLFFIDITNRNILPSKEGLDAEKIHVCNVLDDGRYYMYMPKGLNDVIYFTYDAKYNEILGCSSHDEQDIQRVNSIMFPQVSQIAENFKRVYNKIKDFENV